jgi:hypothetical protein
LGGGGGLGRMRLRGGVDATVIVYWQVVCVERRSLLRAAEKLGEEG